jgi:hypothetical protein
LHQFQQEDADEVHDAHQQHAQQQQLAEAVGPAQMRPWVASKRTESCCASAFACFMSPWELANSTDSARRHGFPSQMLDLAAGCGCSIWLSCKQL